MRNLITSWRLDTRPLLIPMKDSSIFWLDYRHYSVSIHFTLPRNFKRRQRCFVFFSNLLPDTTWKASREFWQMFFPRTDLAFVHAICLSETHQYSSHLDGACSDISTIDVFVSWKKTHIQVMLVLVLKHCPNFMYRPCIKHENQCWRRRIRSVFM